MEADPKPFYNSINDVVWQEFFWALIPSKRLAVEYPSRGHPPVCTAPLRRIAPHGSVVLLLDGLHLIPSWWSGILHKPLI